MFIQETHVQKIFRRRKTWRVSLYLSLRTVLLPAQARTSERSRNSSARNTGRGTGNEKVMFWPASFRAAGSFRLFRRIWGARDRVILKMAETSGAKQRESGKWEIARVYDVDDKFARLRPVEIQQFVAFFTWGARRNISNVEKNLSANDISSRLFRENFTILNTWFFFY